MIVSDSLRYVYIGIPRTASKSMNHWLIEHFDGRTHARHHQTEVPEEFRDYLIFTIVRNPYDLWVSYAFLVAWGEEAPTESEIGPYCNQGERLRQFRAVLETREREQRDAPQQPTEPLEDRIASAQSDSDGYLQMRGIKEAGVTLALYYERLPDCLAELPFVDGSNVRPFPHHPEKGIRPPGEFYDFFPPEEEQVVWATASRDFETLHYHRHELGLPKDAPNAIWLED